MQGEITVVVLGRSRDLLSYPLGDGYIRSLIRKFDFGKDEPLIVALEDIDFPKHPIVSDVMTLLGDDILTTDGEEFECVLHRDLVLVLGSDDRASALDPLIVMKPLSSDTRMRTPRDELFLMYPCLIVNTRSAWDRIASSRRRNFLSISTPISS